MIKKIGLGLLVASAVVLPLLMVVQPAHADVPDPATFATQVASTTNTGADYVTNMLFGGGLLRFLFYITVLGILVWFVYRGIRRIV